MPAGAWRWAALGFIVLALAAAGLAVGAPDAARWAGVALLAGIGAVASLFLYAVWPRESVNAAESKLIAEAATRANVAWAVIGADGAVIDCNDIYRGMAGVSEGDVPPPPELALGSEASAATLYRLTRSAEEGKAREEIFAFAPGLEVAAAVRPLSNGSSAWWFAPRLITTAPVPATDATAKASAPAVPPTAFFRDAPVGVAIADGMGRILEANTAFSEFLNGSVGQTIGDLIEPADAPAVADLITKAKDGTHGIAAVDVRPAGNGERMAELYASAANGGGNVILYLVDVSDRKSVV